MTDPQGAVIPIMPYKVPRDLTKLLVSAHALLGERLTEIQDRNNNGGFKESKHTTQGPE